MLTYPHIDPVLMHIGPFAVHWYGMMYLLSFLVSYGVTRYLVVKRKFPMDREMQDMLYLYLMAGVVLGGRLGYVLFYDLKAYLQSPLDILAVWKGGMSFHGGLIGVIVSVILYGRNYKLPFWGITDILTVSVPIGLGLGRLGNFINGELFGRVTQVPWGMVFPEGGPLPRHPSQLYEAFLEGVILFILLWLLKERVKNQTGVLSSIFLIGYSIIRFTVEFFREPDPQLGYLAGFITMGQVLSLLMLLAGIILLGLRMKAARVK
jgi:phosphatidylglycerol:prolipoprotein diacylglycerol transferase